MKITNVENRYLVKVGNDEILIEEARNEKGEKIYVFQSLKKAKLPNGEEWNEDLSNVKRIEKREELPDEVKKVLRKTLNLI